MPNRPARNRVFLFLQGPHGPFFGALSNMLRVAGATCWRVGFNAGDQAFWRDRDSYLPFRGTTDHWPDALRRILSERGVTDLVLYGDTRPVHAQAVEIARELGLEVHVFEEGYLRPYWVTYERGGSNGNSRLISMTLNEMQSALARYEPDPPLPPAHWGDMRQHVFYGALYHWFVMFANRGYCNYRPHRALPVSRELLLNIKRLLLMPVHATDRRLATRRIRTGGFPYHLAMLQLEHDSAFQTHSPFDTMTDFLGKVMEAFADGAPAHHHLVIKAHPLEDGRKPLRRTTRELADRFGLTGRVHYVRGGKLAQLLDHARSAVTVNSTAGQQALWRGLPLKIFGKAVYDLPEFVSDQPLRDFFAHPQRPDSRGYRDYRQYLLETSQIPGGYYSASGRRQLLRLVVDMILLADDPYDAMATGTAAPRQQLRAVV